MSEPNTPALFDLSQCERHLVELAEPDAARFTGSTVEKDRQRVDAVLSAVVAGVPREHIAALAKISTHTIAGIVDRAERSGEIAGWKERMSRLLARATETMAATLVEAVEQKKLAPAALPVSLGIAVDKKLLLDGEATSRVEHVERVRPEDITALIKRAKVVDIEPAKLTN
ncbi:MAG: hypothetical protein FJW40_27320 [Acidobacteria bacterium]|nr:hypothetical protein [Acidobacteriota bacterium]